MFFEISNFLKFFLSPITWIILLVILSFKLKKAAWRKVCLIMAVIFFVFFTNGLLVNYMRHQMIKSYCNTQIEEGKEYELAIVMGGFASVNKTTGQLQYEENRADRLWEAIRLWKNGRIKQILITGDPTIQIQEDGTSNKQLFLNYMTEMGIPSETFILEQHAKNTRQNALNTAQVLSQLNILDNDCLLITSATHMKRSLDCFSKVGIHLDYLTVNNYEKPQNINHRSFYPSWKAAVEWDELLNEWIGEIAYKIMGYT